MKCGTKRFVSQGGTEVRSRFDPGFCGEFGVASIRINRAGLGGSAIDVWLRTSSMADCAAAKFAVAVAVAVAVADVLQAPTD